MADLRVIYLAHPRTAVPAPELMVRFDAFQGPPVCQVDRKALVGLSVVHPEEFKPYEDHSSGTVVNRSIEAPRDKGALDRTHTEELDARFGEATPT